MISSSFNHFLFRFLILAIFILINTQNILIAQFSMRDFTLLQAHSISISKDKIEYFRFGKGSPIVLVGGYGTTLSSWNRRFLFALSQSNEVIIFNNRNIGGTIINSDSYTSQDLANDIYHLIQQLKLPKVTLLGVSMGGMIAQQLAVLHPEVISHLVLINTAIAGEKSSPPNYFVEDSLFNPPCNKLKKFYVGINLLAPLRWRPYVAFALERERFLPNNYHQAIVTDNVLYHQQRLVQQWSQDNLTGNLITKIKIPVLILNGGADQVIPPENSEILVKLIPKAKLIRWPEGGHAMIYQYSESIAQAITKFIN